MGLKLIEVSFFYLFIKNGVKGKISGYTTFTIPGNEFTGTEQTYLQTQGHHSEKIALKFPELGSLVTGRVTNWGKFVVLYFYIHVTFGFE